MAKIDYKAYLAQFGKIETDAKARIKAYLEEQSKTDEALRNLYRPEKIDDCYNFIKDAVRAMPGSGSSATVEDAIVFKMARDYYFDILPKEADEQSKAEETGAETAKEVETEAEETGAETAKEVETEAETELAENEPADNENEGTLCEETESENEKPIEEAMLHQAGEGEESGESEVSEAETELAEEKPADNENEAETDEYGFEIFGAPSSGAETAKEVETEAETELAENEPADNENEGTPCEETESENEKPEAIELPKYDEEGNGLLFGF